MKRGTGQLDKISPDDVAGRLDPIGAGRSDARLDLTEHDTVRRLAALFESLMVQGVNPWLSFGEWTPDPTPVAGRYAVASVDGYWMAGDLARRVVLSGVVDQYEIAEPVEGLTFACATLGVAEAVAMTARAVGFAAARYRSTVEIVLPR